MGEINHPELTEPAEASTEAQEEPSAPFLSISGATLSDGDRIVFGGIDLAAERGEILVLLGPERAGKSALCRAIAGRLGFDEGSITIDGGDPRTSARARRAIGFAPQGLAVWEALTVTENLWAIGKIMGLRRGVAARRARAAAAAVGLAEQAGERASELPALLRRRLHIGMALVHGPRLLVLDEPMADLGTEGRLALAELIGGLRDQGLGVLLATRGSDEAEALADRAAILVEGTIRAAGAPEELIGRLFGRGKELVVSVEPGAVEDGGSLHFTLFRNGFRREPEGDLWRAQVQWSHADIADFTEHLLSNEQAIREIRVRQPGLDSALARLAGGE